MLAKKISYARAYIAQVELAREAPSAQFVHACDQALHTGGALMELYRRFDNASRDARSVPSPAPSPDDLWNPAMAPPPPASALDPLIREQHNRRAFLRDVTIMAGTATAVGAGLAERGDEPWQRLTAALRGTIRVDSTTVTNLERVTVGLERLESQLSPNALVGAVIGHLDSISQLLHAPMTLPLWQRLCSIAAETSALAGWLTWDLNTPTAAHSYFRAGLDAADDAGDRAIGAYLVGGLCVQPSHREQPQARLNGLNGDRLGYSESDASPATRSWMACLTAEAHVMLGDERAALAELDRAEAMLQRADDDPGQRRPRVTFFDQARLLGERGVALARLGRAEPAQDVLTLAMTTLDPTMTKIRPRLLAELASSAIQTGEIDTACQHTTQALAMAADLQVEPNLQDVYRIRRDLQPWADTASVRDLDRRLADLKPARSHTH